MEAVGFGLAIVTEARSLVDGITTRISNIRDGPETFRILIEKLNRLLRHLEELDALLQRTPVAVPEEVSIVFNETFESVRDALILSSSTVESVCLKAFPERTSGTRAKLKTLFHRTVHATAISNTMSGLQQPLQEASSQLLTLTSMLASRLNIQEHQDVIVPRLDNLRVSGNAEEVYCVGASTPELPLGTTLNFDAKDEDGNHCTPEGMLKASILSPESSSTVSVAVGVSTPALGVVGMAGVGKTIALQSLAFDDDIRLRFPHGIQYIALGQGATLPTAIGEVAKIMRLSGASASVPAVKDSALLREAVDYAVSWFEGRTCLFLVDDLWPTEGCPTGFSNDLRQLLRSCSESRMAVTTRSTIIAHSAGRPVDFAPRASLGDVSVNMFLAHAKQDAAKKGLEELTGDLRKSILTILTNCAGLPIALAVAGCTVAFLANEQGDFEGACGEYAIGLEEQSIELGEEQGPGGGSLNAGLPSP